MGNIRENIKSEFNDERDSVSCRRSGVNRQSVDTNNPIIKLILHDLQQNININIIITIIRRFLQARKRRLHSMALWITERFFFIR